MKHVYSPKEKEREKEKKRKEIQHIGSQVRTANTN
jgi:hypothetical protein